MGKSICRESMASPIVAVMLILVLPKCVPVFGLLNQDIDSIEVALNLEFLEAEFFLFGAFGYGLDKVAPQLTKGGPPPIGATKANLDNLTTDLITQFAFQELGHLRALEKIVPGFLRPQLNLNAQVFAKLVNSAFGRELIPPFDPYINSLNFLIASYVIPYVGLTGYVGASQNLNNPTFKTLAASLLGVESGQDAVIRTLLYERRDTIVEPYNITVAEFTNRISELRNKLGGAGLKDEGLVVSTALGAEGRVSGNLLSADRNSLSYGRTPMEILGIIYGTGNKRVPGGFFPNGANGRIARSYLLRA